MSKEYNPRVHTAVTVKAPEAKNELERPLFGPHAIVLHVGDRVWIPSTFNFVGVWAEVKQVGGKKAFDQDGNCVLSVPAEWCKFYTEEEADDIVRCMDADNKLLGYAR